MSLFSFLFGGFYDDDTSTASNAGSSFEEVKPYISIFDPAFAHLPDNVYHGTDLDPTRHDNITNPAYADRVENVFHGTAIDPTATVMMAASTDSFGTDDQFSSSDDYYCGCDDSFDSSFGSSFMDDDSFGSSFSHDDSFCSCGCDSGFGSDF